MKFDTGNIESGKEDDLQLISIAQLKEKLGYSPGGLTQIEALERLSRYGANEIKENETHPHSEIPILIFNFYPLTAVMIVMLALLNDGAILAIAFDNVRYKNQPEAWNMRIVLGIATVLGLIGPLASFSLFYLGDTIFLLDRQHLQSMMYLKLLEALNRVIKNLNIQGCK